MSLYADTKEVQEKVQAGDELAEPSVLSLTITGDEFHFANVPTSDPSVTGQVWANTNVLTISNP